MAKFRFWQAVIDYLTTRKRLWVKFVAPSIITAIYAVLMLKLNMNYGVKIDEVFNSFVNVQIGAVAILISFSIAIMTILVTSDSESINNIKKTPSDECKPIKGIPLNMFQVLLSNITYKILVEVIYLGILIAFIFAQLFVSEGILKILMGVSIFLITHILHILLESVGKMYFTFWK